MADLARYLRDAAARPLVWGEFDCCMFACNWIVEARGVDPAAPFRRRYRTALGAARHIRRAGGFEALVRDGFAAVGLPAKDDAAPGDVGLVPVQDGPTGFALAIRTEGGSWAAKSPAGLIVGAMQEVRVWGLA